MMKRILMAMLGVALGLTAAKYFELYPQDKIKFYRDPDDLSPAPIFAKIRGFAKVFDKFTERDRKEFMRATLPRSVFRD